VGPAPAGATFGAWTCTGTCPTASGTGPLDQLLDLAVDQAATFVLAAEVDEAAPLELIATATIAVPSDRADPVPANNTATDSDAIATADLGVELSDGRAFFEAGETITYTAVITNAGPQAVEQALLDLVPPTSGVAEVDWTCAATGGAACPSTTGAGSILDALLDIPAGGTLTYTVSFRVEPDAPQQLTTDAELVATRFDPDLSNNVASDSNAQLPPLLTDGFED
jgi:uncharacterized repeat protein (TIGR01451 family)